jgi:hypothetical protein
MLGAHALWMANDQLYYRAVGAGQAGQAMAWPLLVDLLVKVIGAIYMYTPCMPQQSNSRQTHNLSTNDGPDNLKFASYGPVLSKTEG